MSRRYYKKVELINSMDVFEKEKILIKNLKNMNKKEQYKYIKSFYENNFFIPKKVKNRDNLIKGCHSKTWLYVFTYKKKGFLLGFSESIIVKSLLNFFSKIFNGIYIQQTWFFKISTLKKIGVFNIFSINRQNGILSIINRILFEFRQKK